jgi:hypothetical protein
MKTRFPLASPRRAALILAATVATAAAAQNINTRLALQVSHDGLTWASSVTAVPGDTIEVRAVATYIGPGTSAGLGQIVFQPIVEGWRPTDTLLTTPGTPGNIGIGPVGGYRSTPVGIVPDGPGIWGRIAPFALSSTTTSTFIRGHLGTGTAAGMLRIARANITNWIGVGPTSGPEGENNGSGIGGVVASQISSSGRGPFDPGYNALTQDVPLFRFGFTIGLDADVRSMRLWTWNGPSAGPVPPPPFTENVRWFANLSETSASLLGYAQHVDAFVHIVPAPVSLSLLTLCGLISHRRRR